MATNQLINYKVANTVDVQENSLTLNLIASNPGNTHTLWIDSATGQLHRGSINVETIAPTLTASTFVPTFTALEGTPNTYTNILSIYMKNGSVVSVWSIYSVLANATATGAVNITAPFTSGSALAPVFAANSVTLATGAAVTTNNIGNILASNTTSTINVVTLANLTSGTTYNCVLNYSYVT